MGRKMPKGGPKKRIIIINDDAEVRRIAARVLDLEGFAVLQVENGEEGLRLMREKTSDLVLAELIQNS